MSDAQQPLWSDDQRPWVNEELNSNSKLGVAARLMSKWGKDWHKEFLSLTYDYAHSEIADMADAITALLIERDEYAAKLADSQRDNNDLLIASDSMLSKIRAQADMLAGYDKQVRRLATELDSQPAAQPSTPLQEIVAQLRLCNYTCEAGSLRDNAAWRALERMAQQQGGNQ